MNPINESGIKAEKRLESFLIKHNIPYKRGGNTSIDFTIFTKDKTIYLDTTNQNVSGSVQEKVPHKVWKYHKRIGFDEVIIQRGKLQLHREVMEHLKYIEQTENIKVHVLTDVEVERYLLGLELKQNKFF